VYAPQPVYEPHVYAPAPPPKAKKNLLLLACGGAVLLAVLLAGGFFLNERMGWLEIGGWGEKTVENYAVALSFSEAQREGSYTGAIKRKLPNGQGVFMARNGKGVAYTIEGVWEDGVLNGMGKAAFEDGETYVGEYLNSDWHGFGVWTQPVGDDEFVYEGEFRGHNPANWTEYGAALAAFIYLDGRASSYGDTWRTTVRENRAFFPAETIAGMDALFERVTAGVTYAQLDKNVQKYAGEFLQFRGEIIQIEERNGRTFLIVMDTDWNVYYLVYLGEVDYLKGDTVRFVGTPVCKYSYDNVGGGTTNSIAIMACRIYK